MRYKLLGRSGLRVSELALGTMTFGEEWGWGASRQESRKIYDAFLEAGGNFIDTANRYTEGSSEKFLGEFIASQRDKIVLATKYTLTTPGSDINSGGNHRKNLVQSLEASLKRLKVDYIDLYWVHIWDYLTPVEEVMRALDDQVRAGKILYVGISDTPAWIVSQANILAELRGWTPFVALQIEYSLIQRTVERELLPMARSLDLAVTSWGSIGAGVLTGKYNQPSNEPARIKPDSPSGRLDPRNLAIAAEVVKLAKEIGREPSQVALNWVRQQPGVIIPIVGARSAKQLQQNLACLEFTLTTEQMERLNQVSHIDSGFPHDFWKQDYIKQIVYGGNWDKIDNHHRR
ncbi:MAG: aldo/keto reductase [bacterium]|nr:aldo/keto reductase [bacterium]